MESESRINPEEEKPYNPELSRIIYSAENEGNLKEKFKQQRLTALRPNFDMDDFFKFTELLGTESIPLKSANVLLSDFLLKYGIDFGDSDLDSRVEREQLINRYIELMEEISGEFLVHSTDGVVSPKDQLKILNEKRELIREANGILFKLGIIKIPDTMEYKVNRRNFEVANKLGIKSFPELESLLVDFYSENGVIKTAESRGKLISMSWGCGNAGGLNERRLQKDNKETRDLSNFFNYFGCADRIYASFDDMIFYFLQKKTRETDEAGFREFAYILATLILRCHRMVKFDEKIKQYRAENNIPYESKLEFNEELKASILNLTADVNNLRNIFFHLDECRVIKKNEIHSGKVNFVEDLEYPSEKAMPVKSVRCRELFSELARCFYDEDGNRAMDAEENVKSFLDAYFKPLFQDQSHDLNNYNKVHTHNVFLMDFQNAEDVFGSNDDQNKSKFHLITAYRSNSHQKRDNYIRTLRTLIEHLEYGGIILDDGDRESYTREESLEWLLEIQQANSDVVIDVITTKNNKKLALFIQKYLPEGDFDGAKKCFLSKDQKNSIAINGCSIISLKDFMETKIVQNFRSLIVSILKGKYINDTKIDSHYFLKTNFFRTINEKINQEIMDYILHETIMYIINNLPDLVYKLLNKLPNIKDTLERIRDEDLRIKVIKELLNNGCKNEDFSDGEPFNQNPDISRMTISELLDDINCRVDKIQDLMSLQKKISETLARLSDKESNKYIQDIISEIAIDIKRERDTLKSIQILKDELLPILITNDSNLLKHNFDTLSKLANLDLGMLKLSNNGVDLKNMTKKKKHFFKQIMNILSKANIPINSQIITESIYNDEDKYNQIIDKVEHSEAVISRINHCSEYLNRFPFLLEKN